MQAKIEIRNLETEELSIKMAVAQMLIAGFSDMSPQSWPNLNSAMEEVEESFAAGRISIIAVLGGKPVGWIAAFRQYNGNTYEIHPLVVHPDHRKMGVGAALMKELERRVADTGAMTLWLASDDETGTTSLFDKELYPDPLAALKEIRNVRNHPFEFYQKMGFSLCGVLPDANGLGKPDIFMAKRVRNLR